MPFSSKYPTLGKTELMRFPINCRDNLRMIVDEYERIASTRGIEFLDHMQRNLENSLEKIQ
jgi:hypothetical protein